MELQISPTDYHTWVSPIFVLEYPLKGGPAGRPKWEPMAKNGVYLGQSTLNTGSVALVLNTRTGHVLPQYHVVVDDKFSTVEHMKKVTVPGNWKNLMEEHLELDIQENFTLAKDLHLNEYSSMPLLREA